MKTRANACNSRNGKLHISWLIGALVAIGCAALFLDGAVRKNVQANSLTPPIAVDIESQLRFLERLHELKYHKLTDELRRESAAKVSIERVLNSVEATEVDKRRALFYQLCCSTNVIAVLPDDQIKQAAADGNMQFDQYFSANVPLNFEDHSLATQWAMTLKLNRCVDETRWICSKFAAAFKNLPDSKLGNRRSEFFESIARQLDLLGSKIDVKSKRLDGKQFEIAELRGKWVLVRFWSAYCAPCRAELRKLKAIYAAHRNAGFEIVGICMTPSQSLMVKGPDFEKSEWTELWDSESDANHSLVEQFGVVAAPTSFLINPDGVVDSSDIRADVESGPSSLNERLKKVWHGGPHRVDDELTRHHRD